MNKNFLIIFCYFLIFLEICSASTWGKKDFIVYKGTRSEGVVGILMFNKDIIYPLVCKIETEEGTFEYLYHKLPFAGKGIRGWQLTNKPKRKYTISGKISNEDLENGWYRANDGVQKDGTPNDWVWLPTIKIWMSHNYLCKGKMPSIDGWVYQIEVVDATNWCIKGRLFKDGHELSLQNTNLVTPFGIFRAEKKCSHTENGWLYMMK